jgi:hypothetical protein
MDELTLGLIGAGAVVVGGVVVYNAWQGAKVRRKMPRPMPAETAESFAQDDQHDHSPFIEPARPTTRREPVVGTEPVGDPSSARVEPTFGAATGAAPLDTPADIQAETTTPNGYPEAEGVAEAEGAEAAANEARAASAAKAARSQADEPIEPILPAATTISSAPPAIVDRRIDCIVPIRLNGPVAGDKVIPLAQRLRRAGSKPVHIEGKLEGGAWELLQNGARYEELRAAAQLANRSGALNELEFSEFVTGVQQFADALRRNFRTCSRR